MPEGDTVFQTAARLRLALEDAVLVETRFQVPALATADLSGRRVESVRSLGKHLLIDVASGTGEGPPLSIHSHLKMEGAWHVHRLGARWRRPAHQARVILRTDTYEAVGFDLGLLEVLADPDAALAYLGPDLLAPVFDRDDAIARITAQPDRTVGEALLDQRLMAGVGNVYRSELCFLRGVRPQRVVAEVEVPAMVDLARRMLWANRERSQRTTTGNTAPNARLWVYGRDRKPCRRCGTPIARELLGPAGEDRIVDVCMHCQR